MQCITCQDEGLQVYSTGSQVHLDYNVYSHFHAPLQNYAEQNKRSYYHSSLPPIPRKEVT